VETKISNGRRSSYTTAGASNAAAFKRRAHSLSTSNYNNGKESPSSSAFLSLATLDGSEALASVGSHKLDSFAFASDKLSGDDGLPSIYSTRSSTQNNREKDQPSTLSISTAAASPVKHRNPNYNNKMSSPTTSSCTGALVPALPSSDASTGLSADSGSIPKNDTVIERTYSKVSVYEMIANGNPIMRRRSDSWINATHLLKVAGFSEKAKRTKVLEKEVHDGEHQKIQGGYGKYQGTW
jgi:hypothetical protein